MPKQKRLSYETRKCHQKLLMRNMRQDSIYRKKEQMRDREARCLKREDPVYREMEQIRNKTHLHDKKSKRSKSLNTRKERTLCLKQNKKKDPGKPRKKKEKRCSKAQSESRINEDMQNGDDLMSTSETIKQERPKVCSEVIDKICGVVAEKLRSRFLEILGKESTIHFSCDAALKTKTQASYSSSNGSGFVFADSRNCSDREKEISLASSKGSACLPGTEST